MAAPETLGVDEGFEYPIPDEPQKTAPQYLTREEMDGLVALAHRQHARFLRLLYQEGYPNFTLPQREVEQL